MKNGKSIAKKAGYGIFLVSVSVIMLLPIYYLLVTTFKMPAEAVASPLGLPVHFTFDNYVKAIEAMNYGQAFKNNMIITVTSLLFLQSSEKQVLLQQVYRNVGPFSTDWTSFFPMLVMATLPLVIFYFIMQRQIIEGVVAGAVKG